MGPVTKRPIIPRMVAEQYIQAILLIAKTYVLLTLPGNERRYTFFKIRTI